MMMIPPDILSIALLITAAIACLIAVVLAWFLWRRTAIGRKRLPDMVPIARRVLVETTRDGVIVLDMQNRVMDINPGALKLIGLPEKSCLGEPIDTLLSDWPDAAALFHGTIPPYIEMTPQGSHFNVRLSPLLDHRSQWVGRLMVWGNITPQDTHEDDLQKSPSELEMINNQLEEAICIANEMASQAVMAEAMIKESENKLKTILETSPDGIAISSLDGIIQFATIKTASMWGYDSVDALINKNWLEFVHPSYREKAAFLINEMVNGQLTGAEEYLMVRKDGSSFYTEANANILKDADNRPVGILYVERDITERKRLQEELQQQATTDGLTGLTNRRHFLELAHNELKRAVRLNHPMAIALIDIDHFKSINDALGHAAGDQALLAFTKICQNKIREIDIFARFGGDEFVLLLPETSFEQAYKVVERIRLLLATQPINLGGRLVSTSISSGISTLSSVHENIDTLLSQADQALYRAKEAGRNQVVGYLDLPKKADEIPGPIKT